jgi:hypothetical protein
MSDRYETHVVAWNLQFDASARRMRETFDRIETLLQAILDHLDGKHLLEGRPMSEERDDHIKAMMRQLTAQRREADRREALRRIKLLQGELEKSLPADVPLHRRGFGVMEDSP